MKIFRKDREDGFTLIELIVVVVIIGILTAVAIPTYGAIQGLARVNSLHEANQSALTSLHFRIAKAGGESDGLSDDDRTSYVNWSAEGEQIDPGGISTMAEALKPHTVTLKNGEVNESFIYCSYSWAQMGEETVGRVDGDSECTGENAPWDWDSGYEGIE